MNFFTCVNLMRVTLMIFYSKWYESVAENVASAFPRWSHWCTSSKQVKAIIGVFSCLRGRLGHGRTCERSCSTAAAEPPCLQDSLIGSTVLYWTVARLPHCHLTAHDISLLAGCWWTMLLCWQEDKDVQYTTWFLRLKVYASSTHGFPPAS